MLADGERWKIVEGDCIAGMRTLPDASVNCCVTSPPYWGLRDYQCEGQIGLESTPEAYVARIVEVFREVWRVLRDDGTCWVNLGDSYCSTDKWGGGKSGNNGKHTVTGDGKVPSWAVRAKKPAIQGLKPKDLVGIPWRVAFALQADGWYLRQDIVWHKPNPMPESVQDRCTKAHEYVFLLAKSERYFYDIEAMKEEGCEPRQFWEHTRGSGEDALTRGIASRQARGPSGFGATGTRNRRSVWTIATEPYAGAHFATMPTELVKPCIKAGCPEGGVVLDPFAGSGTTLAVAVQLGRRGIGCELNPEYIALAKARIAEAQQSVALFDNLDDATMPTLFA